MIFFIFVTSNSNNMGLISLSGMEFFAYHGCYNEEQILGNKFMVDLEFFTGTENAEITDDLAQTVNYQKVYELVKAEMDIKSKLLEHVSRRILDALYKQFPYISAAKITIAKLNPPIGGKVEKVSVTLSGKA